MFGIDFIVENLWYILFIVIGYIIGYILAIVFLSYRYMTKGECPLCKALKKEMSKNEKKI